MVLKKGRIYIMNYKNFIFGNSSAAFLSVVGANSNYTVCIKWQTQSVYFCNNMDSETG